MNTRAQAATVTSAMRSARVARGCFPFGLAHLIFKAIVAPSYSAFSGSSSPLLQVRRI
jgi:hypothetical protein